MLRTELIATVPELLARHAEQRPDRVAFHDERTTVTYAQLAERTARLAGHLAALGVEPGDRALLYLDNSVETAESYLAIPRAGGIAVCVNPQSARAEVTHVLDDARPTVVITDAAHADTVQELVAPGTAVVVTGEQYDALVTSDPAAPARDCLGLDDVAWMLYTSGTTGRPKGVLLTQHSCLWVVAACWAPIAGLSADDELLCPLPLFHSYALDLCVVGAVAVGCSVEILRRFTTDGVLARLRSGEVTFFPGVPTMYHYLLEAAGPEALRGNRLRVAISAGAIMPASLNRAVEEAFGVTLLDGYGITETSTMVVMNWPTGGRVMGSCGLPVPGLTVRLVDPATGVDVATGEDGELWVSGPGVMVGYHDRPDATAAVLVDGWYRTGDLARRDADGFITISGRIKELIIRGGENIYPAEVEDVLLSLDGVRDAAVVARPHERLGEVPIAYIVPADGLDAAQVIAGCRERLSAFKVPADLYAVDEIPRTGSGKIMRYKLAQRTDLTPLT